MEEKIFVVQEHWASQHHFDFRLEKDGVLKSWVVPQALPMQSGERKLAIAVDDHDLEYASFEGEIAEGYGRGRVRIWDKGVYQALKWEEDEILFTLQGEKLHGKYALVRMKQGKFASSGNDWLLIKRKEE